MDDAWSAALIAWAMRAADAIAAAEGDTRIRPHELARPGRPLAVPDSTPVGRPPLAAPRPVRAVPLNGSAA